MNKQSAKRRREDDDDGSAIAIDRLSQKDNLSRLPKRCFSYCQNHGARKTEIWPFLDKTLQRYLDQNLSLQKFLVDIYHYKVDFVLLRKWIPVRNSNLCIIQIMALSMARPLKC
ncbi:hypothetical protein CASFOL_021891 [Castilleja foliolosa]|uniref:Uncharacterized protein n=1 Tax=Castilleja foliolosa TaxID=1961234 RepID=A0ABD3CZG2_9LAMI